MDGKRRDACGDPRKRGAKSYPISAELSSDGKPLGELKVNLVVHDIVLKPAPEFSGRAVVLTPMRSAIFTNAKPSTKPSGISSSRT